MNNELFDNKLAILYILRQTNNQLTIEQLVMLCQGLSLTYFDISQYVQELCSKDYITVSIADGNKYYMISESGEHILDELIELVSGIDLLALKNRIEGSIKEYKSSYKIDTSITHITGDEYRVRCFIKDGNDELISINIYAGDIDNAKKISAHWKDNANELYTKILELMT